MNRSRLAVAIGAAVLLLAAVVLVPMLVGNDDDAATAGSRAGSATDTSGSLPAPSVADESTGLDRVETVDVVV